jgi:hypothetical protein
LILSRIEATHSATDGICFLRRWEAVCRLHLESARREGGLTRGTLACITLPRRKKQEKPLDRTDETDKTLSGEVLSVLSVPSSGISEKFPAGDSRVLGIRRPPDRQNLNAENSGKHLPHELSKLSKPLLELIASPNPMKSRSRNAKPCQWTACGSPTLTVGLGCNARSRCGDLQPDKRKFGSDTMLFHGKVIGKSERPIYDAARWLNSKSHRSVRIFA